MIQFHTYKTRHVDGRWVVSVFDKAVQPSDDRVHGKSLIVCLEDQADFVIEMLQYVGGDNVRSPAPGEEGG